MTTISGCAHLESIANTHTDTETLIKKSDIAYKNKNYSEAAQIYQILADRNNIYAQNKLGNMYQKGQGVYKDTPKAIFWFKKSAESGFADSQYQIGNIYYYGENVSKNYKEAAYWYEKAAIKGDVRAQTALGIMYSYGGEGIDQNYTTAAYWYQKAAEVGGLQAQLHLGYLYLHGLGVNKDEELAKSLWKKICDIGEKKACKNLNTIKNK
ncbi:hypothetical protein A1D29_04805 [Pasteurellaceae bacterium Orientalotternb1]|nr:hypothetical protein A1D29_04805 [Pasteurellaceae bacterium Orientalotternb1]